MNYFRRTLPSLDALVFFEAAARHENFTHAAQELHVSQVAVSKRIRALEVDIGVSLFQREGRALRLTKEGQALAERVRAGLGFLEDALASARSTRRRRQALLIAANENINFFWLAPLVREFQMSGNDAVISVVTANNVSDVVRAETDLAVFYGKQPPEGWSAHALFDEVLAPVASPACACAVETGAINQVTLLNYRKEAPEWVNWDTPGLLDAESRLSAAALQPCSSYIQSISLALEGRGVALGVLPLLHRELDAGRLVIMGRPRPTGHRYFLATPEGRSGPAALAELLDFLQEQALRSDNAHTV